MAKSLLETLLANLNALLQAQEISQAELARRAGVPQTTVSRVFHALEDRMSPRLETLEGIARGFGVPIASLFSGEVAQAPSTEIESPLILARQIGRLTEDFLISGSCGRADILRKADECAQAALRNRR